LNFLISRHLTYFLNCSVAILLHESGWRREIEGMKVALLGPEGTFTHQAADMYFDDFEPVFCNTIREIFDSDIETKFVPVENSMSGGVSDTLDLLEQFDDEVTAEIHMDIKHVLVSEEDSIEDVEKVKSHPQALSQCKEIISIQDWEEMDAVSTAAAVNDLGEGEAALASRISADINGKNILKSNVEDADSNITRFFVLNGKDTGQDKSALILAPKEDRPGILESMLSCFSDLKVNLAYIHSIPTDQEPFGDYRFYIEARTAGEELENIIECLNQYADVIRKGEFAVFGDES
jgi:prephenate dehydratase